MKEKIHSHVINGLIFICIVGFITICAGTTIRSSAKNKLIETQKEQIALLESKVYSLETLNGYVLAMEQLLPPLVIMELRMYNEVIRQKKIKIATSSNLKETPYGK